MCWSPLRPSSGRRSRDCPAPPSPTAAAALRPGPVTTPTAAAKQALRSLAHRAIALAAEAAALGTQLDELTTAVAPALRALTGIGPDGAATLLTAAGDNPDRIHSEAGFAALCGTNPIPASSGKTTRYRLNRGGNRQANAALHRAVITRLRHHEPTKAYMQRRLAESKSTKEILRCLKRYLAREVYHQLNPTTPVGTALTIFRPRLDEHRSITPYGREP